MGYSKNNQVNHAPAVSLNSADYLTDSRIIKEYQQIQLDHLHRASWFELFSNQPTTRRIARTAFRLLLIIMAFCIAGGVLYYLQRNASLAIRS